ncbi:MAG: phenylalanine--tRNA ligase subunit alpha [Candidatus Moraniibacteriota bacterium]
MSHPEDLLVTQALEALGSIADQQALALWQQQYLGRKSEIASRFSALKTLRPEARGREGAALQKARTVLQEAFSVREQELAFGTTTSEDAIPFDVTAPGTPVSTGHLHPITLLEERVEEIFGSLGFDMYDGPELETEHYNFDALNFPPDHPARDMQDTFWVKAHAKKAKKGERLLLRTHTSPGQVRYMERHKPPLRVVVPGRVFRNEATDASHEHTFHQFECLMVDEAGIVTVATFKHLAGLFFEQFFGRKVSVRLRPSFFPFTEPSLNLILPACSAAVRAVLPARRLAGSRSAGPAWSISMCLKQPAIRAANTRALPGVSA